MEWVGDLFCVDFVSDTDDHHSPPEITTMPCGRAKRATNSRQSPRAKELRKTLKLRKMKTKMTSQPGRCLLRKRLISKIFRLADEDEDGDVDGEGVGEEDIVLDDGKDKEIDGDIEAGLWRLDEWTIANEWDALVEKVAAYTVKARYLVAPSGSLDDSLIAF